MDDLRSIWAAWSPEVRAEVLQIREPAIVQSVQQHMRYLLTACQLGGTGVFHSTDNVELQPLLSTMQFHTAVSPPNGDMTVVHHQIVRWPRELLDDATVMPDMLRRSLEANGHVSSTRPNKAMHWEQLLHAPATTWAGFERQIAQFLEQLILHHHAHSVEQSSVNAIASITGHSRSCSSSAICQSEKIPAITPSLEDDEEEEDQCALGERGSEAPANNGRAAKRARQRERRKMFKAAARATGGEDSVPTTPFVAVGNSDAIDLPSPKLPPLRNGQSNLTWLDTGQSIARLGMPLKPAVVPRIDGGLDADLDDWHGGLSMQPVVVPVNPTPELGMRASAAVGVAGERGVARGAGGGRPADPVPQKLEKQPYVWQPPGLWEPARIPMKDDFSADDDAMLADADQDEVVSIKEAKPQIAVLSGQDTSPEIVPVQVDEVDPEKPRLVKVDEWRTRKNSVDELSKMVEKLLYKDAPTTDPWTGRPVGDGLSQMMGLGRGKPMSEGEPQGRYSDHTGVGMGRGRVMAPPPGFGGPQAHRVHRAPGGLSKEWLPGPAIPEDEELDPEPQLRELQAATLYSQCVLEASSRLESEEGRRTPSVWSKAGSEEGRTQSVWSKASFCATPSMPWSKTPSPPGTPQLQSRTLTDFSQPVMHGTFGDMPMPMTTGLPSHVANAHYSNSLTNCLESLQSYAYVPVAHTKRCPHCGGAFALAKDAGDALPHNPSVPNVSNGHTRDREALG